MTPAPRLASLALTALAFVPGALACGETKSAVDVQIGDSSNWMDLKTPESAQNDVQVGVACCPTGNCDLGMTCFEGACLPSPGDTGCYVDAQCAAGQECAGATACGCGDTECTPTLGLCQYPSGCCNDDAACGAGEACVLGRCKAKPAAAGACWRDDHCAAGEVCEGMTNCPCGDTACAEAAGHCGLAGVCCKGDAECGASGVCRGSRCVAKAAGGGCWGNEDCTAAGETCLGAALCACVPGASEDAACVVPPTAGHCGKVADSCCGKDSDCGAGNVCVEGRGCVAAPDRAKDECWVDGHCGAGRVCDDARVCGCNEDGCTASVVGQCRTLALPCNGSSDCPTAMRCVVPDGVSCPGAEAVTTGVCTPIVDEGCWNSAECHKSVRCSADVVCDDPAGCDAPNVPGRCDVKVKKWDCCASHLECADGLECRNQDTSVTCPPSPSAICVPTPSYGETCWNSEDCPEGKTCYGVYVCGCNGKCRWNHQGNCQIPVNCQSDLDCGGDARCARDLDCIYSPCTTAFNCPPGGVCQLTVEGGCWTHEECGDGNYCQGLRVCPLGNECPWPDMPGTCAPRAGLGGCCSSYRGCDPGLRCVSVADRTSCSIDTTSVCVPAVTMGIACYVDEDCETDQRCSGATVCPCGVETCTATPKAGQCVGK